MARIALLMLHFHDVGAEGQDNKPKKPAAFTSARRKATLVR
jgi:hypothetical protein